MSGAHAHALHYHGHSPLHHAAPQVKLAGLFLFVLAVVTTPPVAVWAFSIYAAILVSLVGMASIPPRFFLTRLSIDLPFVLFAFLLPFVGEGPRVDLGFLSLSSAGLLGAWNILVKATLGAGASVLLAATTEVSDIITGSSQAEGSDRVYRDCSLHDPVSGSDRRRDEAHPDRDDRPRL